MKDFVKIKNGVHRSKPVVNAVFPLLKGVSFGKRGAFVTVDASALMYQQPHKNIITLYLKI
jgi:hypothetical protein